jgi:hypothetical protein
VDQVLQLRKWRGVGCHVEAIDGSAEMVAAASKHPGVTARQATFDDLPSQATYHGIYANFSLLHATRADFKRHIQACHASLYPGGSFHLAMKLGTGEKRDTLGRFYTYYTAEELEDILTQAGFTLTFQRNGQEKGLAGDVEPFIMIGRPCLTSSPIPMAPAVAIPARAAGVW